VKAADQLDRLPDFGVLLIKSELDFGLMAALIDRVVVFEERPTW
jgi:hypothetical protein